MKPAANGRLLNVQIITLLLVVLVLFTYIYYMYPFVIIQMKILTDNENDLPKDIIQITTALSGIVDK